MIDALIDKQDSVEIVRDTIGAILVAEIANQMILAPLAMPPQLAADYKVRIFTERSNAFEQFLNVPPADPSPFVNLWVDNETFDKAGSNVMQRAKTTATYNIDCYGYGQSADDGATGHIPGDREAAFECQRAVRLVRNILMSNQYVYLGLRGVVWGTWPQSISYFQPEAEGVPLQNIVAARIAFEVTFNEVSPQNAEEVLEELNVCIQRQSDGMLVAEAEYAYPL